MLSMVLVVATTTREADFCHILSNIYTLPVWIILYSNYPSIQELDPTLFINFIEFQMTTPIVLDSPEYTQ